ncbi:MULTISPECIES: hypothetical protein [unclassified Mesorhizobium]|uniref:hypothetical protein n=1 Tax=unclassified Mesorhizobium TaxID=325217 RepID=UPI001093F14F|nr:MULTISPECIES: hypothetical protein [unclassified Mesorhizobium]TGT91711.1 hypothetical protein EN804_01155 [Mesorhizobium sp. M8A.F.Ca.ET.161.01.1.1]TGV44738.1 hypothetical protein EN785_01155 [Mesorhizobium sp. M8A.F.Ca.ET.142.01.1.1]
MTKNYCCVCREEFGAKGIAQKTCSIGCARVLRSTIDHAHKSGDMRRFIEPGDARELMAERTRLMVLEQFQQDYEDLIKHVRKNHPDLLPPHKRD